MNIQTYYSKQVSDVVGEMLDEGHISEKNLSYLLVDQPKAGRYFLLPKIHKSGNTGRPFVSANGHLAEKISVFCSASPAPCPESTVLFTRQHRFLRKQDALGPIPYLNPLCLYECNIALHKYSRTAMARTPMARLPWMSRTRSRVRRDFLQIRYTDNLGRFSSFILQMYVVYTH